MCTGSVWGHFHGRLILLWSFLKEQGFFLGIMYQFSSSGFQPTSQQEAGSSNQFVWCAGQQWCAHC